VAVPGQATEVHQEVAPSWRGSSSLRGEKSHCGPGLLRAGRRGHHLDADRGPLLVALEQIAAQWCVGAIAA
jgi:hypothetical protein